MGILAQNNGLHVASASDSKRSTATESSQGVDFRDCLHLKSSATTVSDDTLLVNPDWVDPSVFSGQVCVVVDPVEPRAANVVRVGDTVLFGSDFPRTGERLLAEGFDVQPVEATELAKAEGALTCCSLIFESLQV